MAKSFWLDIPGDIFTQRAKLRVHDRMPVLLNKADYEFWLDPGMTDVPALSDLLKPYDARDMRFYPVSKRINQVSNDDPGCSLPTVVAEAQNRLF